MSVKLPTAGSMMYAALAAIMVLLAVSFYPRDLGRVAGIHDLAPDDFTEIRLSMSVYEEPVDSGKAPRAEPIAENEIITDIDFFEDVLGVLRNHRMRKRPLARGVDYLRADLTRPALVFLSLPFDNRETVFISISNDSRFVSIWSGDSPYTRYRIYGEGMDTNGLYESVLKLDLVPGE